MSDKERIDSPGIRYVVSKNRFNHRAFQRFCYRKLKTQPFLIRWSSSTVDTVGVQDTV